jgi:predicted ATPase/DNA-binding SARP family transcriptional activator
VRLPTRKVESLLAYLALHPQPHAREHLAALLWGDGTRAQAAASLRTALSALRKPLGAAALIADRHSLQLNPGLDLWVDVRAFQAEAAPAMGDLYAGELLADFYDDWITPLREQLRRLHIGRLLDLTQALRARSEYQQAIQVAQRVLAADLGNEPAHQHLIFCYLAAGDRAEAIAQYERCRAILQREFGVEPLPETTALYHWLRRSEAPPARTAAGGAALPANVPFPISSFVGREAALARLHQALRPTPAAGALLPAVRLLTLTGPGGSGKTRLANQAALGLLGERAYADGIWWVALASLAQPDLVPQAVTQALGVRKAPARGLVEALIEHLRPRQLLLVLDNCEHVLAAAARLAEALLSACAQLQIVATSREAFGMTGEIVMPVPPLSLPARGQTAALSPAALLEAESPRLFLERARAVRAEFNLTADNAAPVARICRALDGIPLAIELAAAQARAFSVEQIAARLLPERTLAALASLSPTAPPRHRTLRAAIAWSYDLLTEPERALFRTLAVFEGGWTLEAARALDNARWSVDGSDRAPRSTDNLLARLVDKSLVVADFSADPTRYRYLDTIGEYAAERLAAHGEADGARRRHLDYFARLAETTAAAQYGPQEFEALKLIDADADNLRAALRAGLELPAAETALGVACNLLRYWTVGGHAREGGDWLRALLARAAAAPAPARLRARALNALGYLDWRRNAVAAARAAFGEALDTARALGPEAALEQGHALRGLGLLDYAERRYGAARRRFAAALTLFQHQEDETGMGFALVGLGEVARAEGRYDEAAEHYVANLALRRAQGGELNAAVCLHNLGQVALARGDLNRAWGFLVESMGVNRRLGYRQGMAITLAAMGAVEADRGAYARGARWLAAAQAWLHTLGEVLEPGDQAVFDRVAASAREALPAAAFAAAWAEGLALAEAGGLGAVAEALADP